MAATTGPVLILAGAGSGKTRVITHRVAHLVVDHGVDSGRVLAVTFTNKAAGEMRARAEALLDGRPLRAWMSTFHSFCVRLLRREAAAAGLDPGFLIYDEDDQLAAVREAMRALDLSEKLHPPRRMLSRISARKNSGRAGEDEDGYASDLTTRVMERYREVLRAAGAVDFDDLLLRAVALLDGNEAVREAWRQRFPFLLVDEYQDTNRPQYELVRLLAGPGGNLTVVGDEDQSIYSWRGADISNILDFERDFPGARVFRLEDNYRSSQRILDAAGALVARNVRRKGKTLRAVKGEGEPVRVHEAMDEFQEAAWVTERIASVRSRGRVAVLFRMNAQSRLFEEGLLRLRLPYLVLGGVGFYERKEVKDVLAYLRLVLNPRDAVAFRRVVNVPPRGIGTKTVEEIDRVAAAGGESLWEATGRLLDEAALPSRALTPLRQFRETLQTLRAEAGGPQPPPADRARPRALRLRRGPRPRGHPGEPGPAREPRRAPLRRRRLRVARGGAQPRRLPRPGGARLRDRPPPRRRAGAAHDPPRRQGAGVRVGVPGRARGGPPPPLAEPHRRGRARGGAAAVLRGHDPGDGAAPPLVGPEPPGVRAAPGDRAQPLPRGDPGGRARALGRPRSGGPGTPATSPRAGRRPPRGGRAAAPAPAAAGTEMRPGSRVRHPLFGVGTVLRREGEGDDLKVTVSFPGVGAKKLVARFAGLEPA